MVTGRINVETFNHLIVIWREIVRSVATNVENTENRCRPQVGRENIFIIVK